MEDEKFESMRQEWCSHPPWFVFLFTCKCYLILRKGHNRSGIGWPGVDEQTNRQKINIEADEQGHKQVTGMRRDERCIIA
jgi:hypothetical protein